MASLAPRRRRSFHQVLPYRAHASVRPTAVSSHVSATGIVPRNDSRVGRPRANQVSYRLAVPSIPYMHSNNYQSKGGLVIGHSFVRHLRTYLRERKDLNLNLSQYNLIIYHGVSGGLLSHMWQEFQMVKEISPHCLVIDVGSNDLCDPEVCPFEFAAALFNFGQYVLLHTMIPHVFIMKLLFRGIHWDPRDGQRSFLEFNRAVFLANGHLDNLCYMHRYDSQHVQFFKSTGLWLDIDKHLCSDGVHLNPMGMAKQARNYRGAFMRAYPFP